MHAAVNRSLLHGAPVSLTPSLSRARSLSLSCVCACVSRSLARYFFPSRVLPSPSCCRMSDTHRVQTQSHSNRKRVLAHAVDTSLGLACMFRRRIPSRVCKVHGVFYVYQCRSLHSTSAREIDDGNSHGASSTCAYNTPIIHETGFKLLASRHAPPPHTHTQHQRY